MKTTVTVLGEDAEQFEGDLVGVIAKLQTCLEKVPIEFVPEAKVTLDVGEYSCYVYVSYQREETEAEKQAREAATRATQEMAEKRDRALLKQLLTKYGEP